jgi:hypothetical protein
MDFFTLNYSSRILKEKERKAEMPSIGTLVLPRFHFHSIALHYFILCFIRNRNFFTAAVVAAVGRWNTHKLHMGRKGWGGRTSFTEPIETQISEFE